MGMVRFITFNMRKEISTDGPTGKLMTCSRSDSGFDSLEPVSRDWLAGTKLYNTLSDGLVGYYGAERHRYKKKREEILNSIFNQ